METQNVNCPTPPLPAPIDMHQGRYHFVGDQEHGIQCVFRRTGKRAPAAFVVARIQGRVFKRLRPEGWREQDSDRLSLVQSRAGLIALTSGLIGPA